MRSRRDVREAAVGQRTTPLRIALPRDLLKGDDIRVLAGDRVSLAREPRRPRPVTATSNIP